MNKWFLPLTVLGMGGLGALFFSDRGRKVLDWVNDRVEEAPERIADWNESAQLELDRIQMALNQVAETLETRPAR